MAAKDIDSQEIKSNSTSLKEKSYDEHIDLSMGLISRMESLDRVEMVPLKTSLKGGTTQVHVNRLPILL